MGVCSAIIIPVESNFIHPARCYANGFTDEDGVKHDRPDCVKFARVPEEKKEKDEKARKAFVEDFAAKFKIMRTNARNWKRLYGRHGWRAHAEGHARLCIVACMCP